MLNNKHIGTILAVIGIVVLVLTFAAKAKEDFYISTLLEGMDGTCILDSGYCLHEDRDWTGYIVGWVVGASALILGAYVFIFENSARTLRQQHHHLKRELRSIKQQDAFQAFLAGFSEEERKVLKAIREQDGILQSTLRYRTGMSKASLSLLLGSLEKKDIINRIPSGKTNKVYLKMVF